MEAGVGSSMRPCFIEEEDGLASLSDMEAGFSGNCQIGQRPLRQGLYSYYRPLYYARRRSSSLNNLSCLVPSSNSPRSTRFYDASRFQDHQPHFLEACFGCKKALGNNKDIFMYRGDTPFCSEECRQDQIEIDEAKERNINLSSSSMQALRKKDQKKSSSSSPTKPRDYPSRAGTVAAA